MQILLVEREENVVGPRPDAYAHGTRITNNAMHNYHHAACGCDLCPDDVDFGVVVNRAVGIPTRRCKQWILIVCAKNRRGELLKNNFDGARKRPCSVANGMREP